MQTIRTQDNREKFLQALKTENGLVATAAESCNLSRTALYAWKNDDDDFSEAWDQIVDITTETLEKEAWRRAHDGVPKDVFYQGEKIATETNYSDQLLMFVLRGRKPETYRDNSKVELGGVGGGPLIIEVDFVQERSAEETPE